MLVKKFDDLIAVQINPRLFAQRIVSARDRSLAMFDLVTAEFVHCFPRKMHGEAEVIKRVNIPLRAMGLGGKLREVCHR